MIDLQFFFILFDIFILSIRFQDNWSVSGSPVHNNVNNIQQQQQMSNQTNRFSHHSYHHQQLTPRGHPFPSHLPASPMHHQHQSSFSNENLPPPSSSSGDINNGNNLTNTEMLHHSFLMMNGAFPQTPPNHHQHHNANMRCQSVPAVAHHTRQPPQTQHESIAYQPLSPQLNRMSRMSNIEGVNAKRNLNFMFDSSPGSLNISNTNTSRNGVPGHGNSAASQDRLVPNSIQGAQLGNIHQHNQQMLPDLQQQSMTLISSSPADHDNLFGDLAFPLNDISSPDDLEDIHLEKIDGTDGDDDLIKSLSNNSNKNDGSSWVNDWSNATLPVMNVL